MPGINQHRKSGKAGYARAAYAHNAASYVKPTRHSRFERLSKLSHLTGPDIPPTMNPAFDPRARTGGKPTRPAAGERPTGSSAQQSAALHEARAEPFFGASGAGAAAGPPYAHSAYPQVGQRAPWYQQTGPLHRNPVSRVMLMACIFAVGAAVGLAATWWMSTPADKQPSQATARKLEPVGKAPGSPTPGAAPDTGLSASGSSGGINPGELPYDGNPPAAAAVPIEKIEQSEPPRAAAVQNPSKAEPEPGQSIPPVVTAPPPGLNKAGKPESAEKMPKAAAAQPTDTRSKAPAKARATRVAKAAPRTPDAPDLAKDREIERIQQQADEELKKKSRGRDVTEAVRARTDDAEKKQEARQAKDEDTPAVAAHGSRRPALARCEREEDSLIGRELCKWKVCGGMWGKNGCPSYERQANFQH